MKIAIIGFGKRGQQFYNILKQDTDIKIVAISDTSEQVLKNYSFDETKICLYNDYKQLLVEHSDDLSMVIVCVPHTEHFSITMECLNRSIHVFKEKPLAIDLKQARALINKSTEVNKNIMLGLQRRFIPIYQHLYDLITNNELGSIKFVEGRYLFNILNLNEGWRKDKSADVLLDMGYHFIDLIVWYFGNIINIAAMRSNNVRSEQYYEADDTVILQCELADYPGALASFLFTRNGVQKEEQLTIIGTKKSVTLTNNELIIFDNNKQEILRIKNDLHDIELRQIQYFKSIIDNQQPQFINSGASNLLHMQLIENIYDAMKKNNNMYGKVDNHMQNNIDFVWPMITESTEKAVVNQLYKEVSIYDSSGIFEEFEKNFSAYHDMSYSLLCNSGTSALLSIFVGINLSPGDKVIVPAYTFYATASPLAILGVEAVLCDCLPDGNIDPDCIENLISSNTKAIIVTHMWGIPCDMVKIKNIASKHKLFLLEDCSHAHGASILVDGKECKVGTFGDAAAWSLQGQKIISGGEGGILLTNDSNIFNRALLLGHYNKRCKKQIPKTDPLYEFALTGFGLKLRAHPLAIAIANEQFQHLDKWLQQKRVFANQMINALRDITFLQMPQYNTDKNPSWYAFVMQFLPDKVSFTKEYFVNRLKEEGLNDIDCPGSTCPLYGLSLFSSKINDFLPQSKPAYNMTGSLLPYNDNNFHVAESFYKNAIKIPVWATMQDEPQVLRYINTIKKVSYELLCKTYSDYIYQIGRNNGDHVTIIAIIGLPCSGKSFLALQIKNEFKEICDIISLENFTQKKKVSAVDDIINLYNNVNIDYESLISQIINIKNYAENTCSKRIIVIDGLFINSDPKLMALIDKKIYLSVPKDVCLYRFSRKNEVALKDIYNNLAYINQIRNKLWNLVTPLKKQSDYLIKTIDNKDIDFKRLIQFIVQSKQIINLYNNVNNQLNNKGYFMPQKNNNSGVNNDAAIQANELVELAKKDNVQKFVVGAVIYYKDRILIVKRSSTESFLPNLNELPSGTVEDGESLMEALYREIKEETNLEINAIEHYLGEFDYKSKSGKLTRQFTFEVSVKLGGIIKLNPQEHSDYILHDPSNDDLSSYQVTPQIEELIRKSIKRKKEISVMKNNMV